MRPRIFTAHIVFVLAATGALAATAAARESAKPAQTSSPTLQGPAANPFVGDTLTTSNGTWSGSPTKFDYQWDRCDPVGDRVNCVPISGATSQSYTAAKADVNHKLHASVFATNADGTGKADTRTSGVVSDAVAPVNKTRPVISGSPTVGSTLTAGNGTWVGATSFRFAWQQCDQNGNNCVSISGATGRAYGVRTSDVGHELRVEVTATNKYGSTRADSNRTPVVTATTQTTTTVVTTTAPSNKAPTIRFISLKRVGVKIYARFRVCDDSNGRIAVIARDNKARTLAFAHRFVVAPVSCGAYSRKWTLLRRFRTHGRLVVTLRAQDASGRLSLLVSRGITIR